VDFFLFFHKMTEIHPQAPRAIDDGVPYCGIFIFFSLVVWVLELYIDLRQRRRLAKKKLPQVARIVLLS